MSLVRILNDIDALTELNIPSASVYTLRDLMLVGSSPLTFDTLRRSIIVSKQSSILVIPTFDMNQHRILRMRFYHYESNDWSNPTPLITLVYDLETEICQLETDLTNSGIPIDKPISDLLIWPICETARPKPEHWDRFFEIIVTLNG